MKRSLSVAVLMALLFTGLAAAQNGQGAGKGQQVSGKKHPNLSAAQRHIEQARQKLEEAQQAHEFDLGGHAKKAKELLAEADREIKQAAEFSNKNGKGSKTE
jgi:hypothetical protein